MKYSHKGIKTSLILEIGHIFKINHRSESVTYLGSKIWKIIPANPKELGTIDKFKIAIEK